MAYRVLVERCLQVLDGILEYRLELEPGDRELATRRVCISSFDFFVIFEGYKSTFSHAVLFFFL